MTMENILWLPQDLWPPDDDGATADFMLTPKPYTHPEALI